MHVRLAAVLATCLPCLATAAPLPVEDFTNFARYDAMKVSPQGKHLALTYRMDDKQLMVIMDLPDLKSGTRTYFGNELEISSFRWANESRLLISPARLFPGLTTYKAPTGEIMGLHINGKNAELLFGPYAGNMQTGSHITQRQSVNAAGSIVDDLPADPEQVLIQTYGYDLEGEYNAAYRMSVNTGRVTKVAGSPLRNGTFTTDAEHRVALVHGDTLAGDYELYHRSPDDRDWKLLQTAKMREGKLIPVGPSAQVGEFLALDTRDAPTSGVVAWSPATNTQRLLFRSPAADSYAVGTDPSGKPWVFAYEEHFPAYWYPDPEHPLAKMHRAFVKKYPRQFVRVINQTDDMSLAVVRIHSAQTPTVFLLMDVRTSKTLQLMEAYPQLKPKDLATVDALEFTARDGLKIRGYVTVPNAVEKKNLPMVVLVHGGPHGVYDDYGFELERQLFASRGYAVLQVNYRGSGGRGNEFEARGYGRWGLEMQDDITDAIRWTIQQGLADRNRICIYGGSYGAYAALTGAYREPDLFKCAIGMAGVYDLPLMFEKGDIQKADKGVNYMLLAIGKDMDELRRRSPVYNADKIRAAVLLLHGKDDQRAPLAHAERMRDALKKAGNPPEWFTEWGEGHGFFDEKHRVDAYERILAFIDRHIGH